MSKVTNGPDRLVSASSQREVSGVKLGPRLSENGMITIPEDHELVLNYKDKVVGR